MAQSRPQATRRRPTTKKRPPRKPTADYTLNWVGLGFLVVAVLGFFAPGIVGIFVANVFRLVVGNAYRLAALLLALFGGWLLATGRTTRLRLRVRIGLAISALSGLGLWTGFSMAALDVHSHFLLATWRQLQNDFAIGSATSDVGGGIVGGAVFNAIAILLSAIGAMILLWLLLAVGVAVIFGIEAKQVFAACQQVAGAIKTAGKRLAAERANRATRKPAKQRTRTIPARPQEAPELKQSPANPNPPLDDFTIHAPEAPKPAPKPIPPNAEQVALDLADEEAAAVDARDSDPANAQVAYQLPDPALLTDVPVADQQSEVAKIKANRVKLKDTLESFGVSVNVKSATLGPSITQYEIQPATGVKVAKILNLADDLALALAAKDIRIEAPIPGKSLIGIEVPNQSVATVSYRDVLMHTPAHAGRPLLIPLGKDVNGQVQTFDLTTMPHLLIAGATGSGKSVMINVIITSILMTAKPTDVRLMLIDPKRVELSVYNGVPHLLTPVVTEAKQAPSALNKVLAEMDRRYERFAAAGVRNMGEYNAKVAAAGAQAPGLEKMPYIVVIVDELSDLMMVAGTEVETAIVRLAQMARAAGIHLIIATQRPSVDVITGLIKANIPSRIAFAVSSGVDSRTILDGNGAEKLLGRGDMLYAPIDAAKPVRIQGAFIPSADVEAVVAAITAQVAPAYVEEMAPSDVVDDDEGNADSSDELYETAKAFVIAQQSASTSLLQRRFRVGYNRAARLIDELQANGVVGPSEGSKPRKVLVAPEATD